MSFLRNDWYVAALAPEFRRARLESSVIDLVRAVLDAPAMIVVDDAHLLDESSLSLLTARAAAPDATWRRFITAPLTGNLLDSGRAKIGSASCRERV